MKRRKSIWLSMTLIIFLTITAFSAASALELPDFSSWTTIFSGAKDYDQDGINDVIIKFLSKHPNPLKTSASALIFHFQPFDSSRIDMAIVLFYTRTNEPGKDTILSARLQFYICEEGKQIISHFVEERVIYRPKKVEKIIKEPMFKEDSFFGQKWFGKFRQFGLTDDEIRKTIPQWGWLPE